MCVSQLRCSPADLPLKPTQWFTMFNLISTVGLSIDYLSIMCQKIVINAQS